MNLTHMANKSDLNNQDNFAIKSKKIDLEPKIDAF